MGFLSKLFTGGGAEIVNGVSGLIGKFKLDPTEKAKLKLELARLVDARDARNSQEILAETTAKASIMIAELKQDDKYTKRLRPTIGYSGLALVLVQIAAQLAGKEITIPMEFWVSWGGLLSVYSIGRSAEKRGNGNKATALITGSKLLD